MSNICKTLEKELRKLKNYKTPIITASKMEIQVLPPADWQCEYCATPQPGERFSCLQCGAPRPLAMPPLVLFSIPEGRKK